MLLPKNYFLEFVLCICCQTNVSVKTSDRFQIVFLRKDNFIQNGQPKTFLCVDFSVAKKLQTLVFVLSCRKNQHSILFTLQIFLHDFLFGHL